MNLRSLLPTVIAVGLMSTSAMAEKPSSNRQAAAPLTQAQAEAFLPTWLGMIDSNAPPKAFLKYLTDTDFEHWSYGDTSIKNTAALKAYFKKNWGMLKNNRNEIIRLTVRPVKHGRFSLVSNVDWTANTAGGKPVGRRLVYELTLGSGPSAADPIGAYPKIFRYSVK